jgi:2-polyprenyl-3-methyl-5-hydroxy-6-metoxy-1,4-benzoquinol methylase
MPTTNYNKLAKVYDALMGPGLGDYYIKLLRGIFHTPIVKKTILDLGCGTGAILRRFSQKNETWGIDASEAMLAIAKAKDRYSTYRRMNITTFKLPRRFDIIICAFDTINHLKSFRQWKQLFRKIAEHLKIGGIFIFDMNTLSKFRSIHNKISVKKIPKGLVFMETITKNNRCSWVVHILEQIGPSKFRFSTERIVEVTFPLVSVQQELRRYFSIVNVTTPDTSKGRVFVVCKKKAEVPSRVAPYSPYLLPLLSEAKSKRRS